ncbi:MAG: hypothetical protein Q8Q89_00130 [bacterium]|nr:hypothetical protein [bacterium]
MFQKGQEVECIEHKMEGIGNVLEKGKTYHIKEYVPANECEKRFSDSLSKHVKFDEHGGRVELVEYPNCYWYSKGFQVR